MNNVIDGSEFGSLSRVFDDVREATRRCACQGERVNLYLWQAGTLVPFEMIEAKPDDFVEGAEHPVWQWVPSSAILGADTDGANERATYAMLGVIIRGTLEARAVVAECVESGADPASIRFCKKAGMSVDDATPMYVLGSDGYSRRS